VYSKHANKHLKEWIQKFNNGKKAEKKEQNKERDSREKLKKNEGKENVYIPYCMMIIYSVILNMTSANCF